DLDLTKYKLGYLSLSVSSALTDGGQPGDQQIPAGPALQGTCQPALPPSVSLWLFCGPQLCSDSDRQLGRRSLPGGGKERLLAEGEEGKAPLPASLTSLLFTPHAALLPLAFPFRMSLMSVLPVCNWVREKGRFL
ncbi:hypothetical protein HispidOSU_031359, partial [Sigmodon hispidus]